MVDRKQKIFAASIALVTWFALVAQAGVSVVYLSAKGWSVLDALLLLAGMFTILTNILAASTMTAVALGRWPAGRTPSASALGAVTVYCAVVGFLYYLLLSWQHDLSGWAFAANWGLHYAVPILVALFWLLCAPKAELRFWHPVAWLGYPLAYLLYTLALGAIMGRYPYSFVDVDRFGLATILINAAVLAAVFLFFGFALVVLSRIRRPETQAA